MDNVAIAVRSARVDDAEGVARVYIDSWHDTYPSILPTGLLRAMTPKGQTARWRAAIGTGGRERVLVAEIPGSGIIGMTSLGPVQDRGLGYDGEVYTLYVAPDFVGMGIGSLLLRAAFAALHAANFSSCAIWAHGRNPARFFYEAMGGKLIAERNRRMGGAAVPEVAFGWTNLVAAARNPETPGTLSRR